MLRKCPFAPDEYYHVYNRGVDRRDVFLCPKDKERFLVLLYVCNSKNPVRIQKHLDQGRPLVGMFSLERGETLVDVGAYCLMPNHFHLLLRERVAGGITEFMRKVITAYTMFFNKKYARQGVLFQGAFKAHHVDSDDYLRYIFSYIHLNPIDIIFPGWTEAPDREHKSHIKKHLETFPFSSLWDYARDVVRSESAILNRGSFPDYFTRRAHLDAHLDDYLVLCGRFSWL
ncbi:MAG: transposase [Candidatus Paceibacterota bacterium]|jgi:putative transposase